MQDLSEILKGLVRNEISITLHEPGEGRSLTGSRFGGRPAVTAGFEWPRFEAEDLDGETANRPLSFLCQIDLEEVAPFDREALLPRKGLLLFFYEQETMCWGFDPEDCGCSRVIYVENTEDAVPAEFPDDLKEEYRVKEYGLSFCAGASYPSFEELECHCDADCDWEEYDEYLAVQDYDEDFERHKLLGYADTIQDEMLTECERTARGLYSGDPASFRNTPEDVAEDIRRSAREWILLFQMASIQEDDYELMFGDCGDLYFYIRRDDLKAGRFDKVWLVSQCG